MKCWAKKKILRHNRLRYFSKPKRSFLWLEPLILVDIYLRSFFTFVSLFFSFLKSSNYCQILPKFFFAIIAPLAEVFLPATSVMGKGRFQTDERAFLRHDRVFSGRFVNSRNTNNYDYRRYVYEEGRRTTTKALPILRSNRFCFHARNESKATVKVN